MAREFSRKFYESTAWKKTREYAFNRDFGLCVKCGDGGQEVHHTTFLTAKNITDPDISLNPDRLITLCRECHKKEHERAVLIARYSMVRNYKPGTLLHEFNEQGETVLKKNVFIVHGAPGSGKSTYVKEHKGKYDIVFDADLLSMALTMSDERTDIPDTLQFVERLRDTVYSIVENRELYFDAVWLIVTMPKRSDRAKLAMKLKGELIHIETNEEECRRRIKLDGTRVNRDKDMSALDYYWREYESPPLN